VSQTVLVIDSNSAVQAITTLALNQTDCAVETLADGGQALDRIRQLNPSVVLCAKEIAGVDPFELCRRIKSELSHTAFVLLAPAEGVQATNKLAKDAAYDEVIFKPFKSNRLREVVTSLIQRLEVPQTASKTFYLAIEDSLRRRIVERYLARYDCSIIPNATPTPALAGTVVCIAEDPKALPGGFTGKSVVLSDNPKGAGLTIEKLTKLLNPLLPKSLLKEESAQGSHPPAETEASLGSMKSVTDTAQLAAEISARIFSRLLTSSALSSRNWEEAAKIAASEVKSRAAVQPEKKRDRK